MKQKEKGSSSKNFITSKNNNYINITILLNLRSNVLFCTILDIQWNLLKSWDNKYFEKKIVSLRNYDEQDTRYEVVVIYSNFSKPKRI